jgi:hypothetical protein
MAKKAALQVFDLSRDDWYAGMTRRQLSSFQFRLFTALSPEEAREMGGAKPDSPLTSVERAEVLRFILDQKR